MYQQESRIYLASRSPRRRELLKQIGVNFELLLFREGTFGGMREQTDVSEIRLPGEAPLDYAVRIAREKAEAGVERIALRNLLAHPVLAADTTIDLDGEVLGKPADAEDAMRMLQGLSGRSHRVLTAIALKHDGRLLEALSVSEVRFRTIAPDEIRRYVASGEPMDKAGAYAVQGHAAMFIAEIRGSYSGIMGLPLYETAELLRRIGYPF